MSRINPKTSLFYDAFTGLSGGGVNYLNGNIIDRVRRVTNVEFSWDLKNVFVLFDSATKTIVMQNQYDNRTFISQGFKVDDTFACADSDSNDGNYTIADISEDGKTITTVESLVDETNDNVSFFGTTPITAIDYYYNTIANNEVTNFTSLVDPLSQQKFTITGILCTNSTPQAFAIGTKSSAWVTEKITDIPNNKTNAVSIKGTGLSNYIQSFEITQFFTVTPFYLTSQFENFENNLHPSYFPQKFVCKVDGKYLAGNPVADISIVDNGVNGVGSWYDEAALGSLGEYSVTSIVYEDNDTADSLERLDVNKNCLVTITVNSRNGKFVSTGSDTDSTMFILGFNADVSDETEYQNTLTTQRQNFFQDSCTNFIGDAGLNGMQFGTGYQSITDCSATLTDANTMVVSFVFSAGATFKTFWKSKENNARYYTINLITQDVAITTTKATDRMTLKCDFQSADYETKTTDLFSFVDTGLEAFKYPDVGNVPLGSLEGFQGDPFYVRIPFLIKQHLGTSDTCTVQKITWQVVGEKTDKEDFIFESKIIDFSNAKKLLSVQQLDYSDTRGFISYANDPCNLVTVVRDATNDTSTESGFVANYGLILRYESWVNALNQFQFTGTEIGIADISKDIETINQDWTSYNNIESWNLFLRFSITIQSLVNNSINTYQTQIPIKVYTEDQVIWSGATGDLTATLQYFNQDESEEIESIVVGGITLIRFTLTGNFPLISGYQYYGQMFSTIEGGNIFSRRLSSSELPSESDSPFSPTAEDLSADFSWAFGNSRINVFTGVKIVLESYFDSTIYGQSKVDVRAIIGAYKPITSGS